MDGMNKDGIGPHQELQENDQYQSGLPNSKNMVEKDKNLEISFERIEDHKLDGDDVKDMLKSKLKEMDYLERFEYRFPFYHMDVNGYIVHIK